LAPKNSASARRRSFHNLVELGRGVKKVARCLTFLIRVQRVFLLLQRQCCLAQTPSKLTTTATLD
jgi:hypothetical protein